MLKGEDTAGSYPIINTATSAIAAQPNLFKNAPPFVAIREAGKGRLAVMAITPVHTIWGYAHPVWQGVTMTEGDGYRKSDLAQIVRQSLPMAGHAATAKLSAAIA